MPLVYFLLKALVDPPATAKNELASRSECLDLKFDLGFEFRSPENIYLGICLPVLYYKKCILVFNFMKLSTDGFCGYYKHLQKTKIFNNHTT